MVSVDIDGKPANLIIVSGKDGRLRIVNRDTQAVLSDIAIARQENTDAPVTVEGVHVCPGLLGGQEWSSSAYDPVRKIVISPMVNWCGTAHRDASPPEYKVGEHYYAGKIVQDPPEEARGVLAAVDVPLGRIRWKVFMDGPALANVSATSSGVIFAGDLRGTLYAVKADDGSILLRHALPGSASGGLLTYAVNGKQYVAGMSGYTSVFFKGTGAAKLTLLSLP